MQSLCYSALFASSIFFSMLQVTSAFPVAQNSQSDRASIGLTALEPIFATPTPSLAATPLLQLGFTATPTTPTAGSFYNIIPASYPNPTISDLHPATPASSIHTYQISAIIWIRMANPVIIDYAYCNPASIGFYKPI